MKTLLSNCILAILIAVSGTSCQSVDLPVGDPDVVLTEPTWQLVAFEDAYGDRMPIDYDSVLPRYTATYTVVFTKQPRECHSPPCRKWNMKVIGYPNQGGFSYELNQNDRQSLAIYFHGQTKMALLPGSKEPEFFDALKAATRYRISGIQLRIFYGDGNVLLFEPADLEEE